MIRYALAIGLAVPAQLLAQQSPPPAGAPAPAQAPAPCADQEHHQFDFWVGNWDVYGPAGRLVAHSLIEQVYGCGIRENWMPLRGGGGTSLSIYVPADHAWQQFWIDASGSRVTFAGGWNGSAMVITGTWATSPATAAGPLIRMTYTRRPDGSVRQFGERSVDQGQSWTTAFDFTYRPHSDQAPA